MPLPTVVHSMTRGRVFEAFLNSSAMCTEASAPMSAEAGVIMPMRVARPVEPHPPSSEKVVHTSCDGDLGPRTHSGTKIAMKPAK